MNDAGMFYEEGGARVMNVGPAHVSVESSSKRERRAVTSDPGADGESRDRPQLGSGHPPSGQVLYTGFGWRVRG
ncbi:MAG: hypothetical protein ACRD3C_23915, partial [Vicinamibacterales bacterium]